MKPISTHLGQTNPAKIYNYLTFGFNLHSYPCSKSDEGVIGPEIPVYAQCSSVVKASNLALKGHAFNFHLHVDYPISITMVVRVVSSLLIFFF